MYFVFALVFPVFVHASILSKFYIVRVPDILMIVDLKLAALAHDMLMSWVGGDPTAKLLCSMHN